MAPLPLVGFLLILAIICVYTPRPTAAQQNGDVRLVDGQVAYEGRVEVYYDHQWGTVCSDGWHYRDADVICKQLGHDRADRVHYRASQFGEGTGPIWLDEVYCPSSAESILECSHNGYGTHDCKHSEDVGVTCRRIVPTKPTEMPLRLTCPQYKQDGSCEACSNKRHPIPGDCTPQAAVEGIVEAYYNGQWKPLSLDGWNDVSAEIVCNELGYPLALGTPTLDELWPNWHTQYCDSSHLQLGSGVGIGTPVPKCSDDEISENANYRSRLTSTWLQKLECLGTESRLLDCYFRAFGPNENPVLQVATVRCGFKPHSSCPLGSSIKETYRTRSGAVDWRGRLEVNIDGEWGTVCDRDFDFKEANIVCKAMGYGGASGIQVRARHGRGDGKIHYSRLRCKGDENYLADCEHSTGSDAEACGHQGDVSVECRVPRVCEEMHMSHILTYSERAYYGHVEVKGPNGWGLLCEGTMDKNAGSAVCKENMGLFVNGMRGGYNTRYNGTRYVGKVFCMPDEEMMERCPMRLSPVANCPKNQDLILECTPDFPDLVPDLYVFRRSLEATRYVDKLSMRDLTCAQEENCLSSSAIGKPSNHYRDLLRFSSQTNNLGMADFRPILDRNQWEWHSCHNHWHSFEAFIHYDLLNITTGEKVAEGHKASFCLEDSTCDGGSTRFRCGTGHQGISQNCGDLYGSHLDCQWIDVTDVPAGTYRLRQHVNPESLSPESDYKNNIVSCDITFYKNPGAFYTRFDVANFKHSDQND